MLEIVKNQCTQATNKDNVLRYLPDNWSIHFNIKTYCMNIKLILLNSIFYDLPTIVAYNGNTCGFLRFFSIDILIPSIIIKSTFLNYYNFFILSIGIVIL